MSLLSDFLDPAAAHGPMRLIARPLYSWSLAGGGIPERLLMIPPDPWTGDAGAGRWIANGILDDHGNHIQITPQLWLSQNMEGDARRTAFVHGFEWLRDLKALGGDMTRRLGRQYMQQWMAHNRRWQLGAWQYGVTARRVAAWLMSYDFFCASGDDVFLADFYDCLLRQIRHLDRARPEKHPERCYGADALAVIRARIFGGLCLEGGEARLADAMAALEQWIAAEIDAEGMHISRSPQQLVVCARYLIDIRSALVRGGLPAPTHLQSAIDRTMHAVRFFRMPDQRLACFHGSREGEAAELDMLLRVSSIKIRKAPTQLHESGFESLGRERTVVIADCGYAAPHPHDQYAHASPLAFEMSVGRDRMIVNCATHPTDLVWIDHLRATAAHSGVTVDDRNTAEIRPDGHIGRAPANVSAHRDMVQGGLMLTMAHDGYAPLNGLVHTRRLKLSADGTLLEGEDVLAGDAPLIKPASYAIRFHLHPRVQASLIQDGQAVLLRLPSGGGWRFSKSAGALSLEPSIYMGTGNAPRKTMQIVLSGVTEGAGASIGWQFTEEA